MREVSQIAVLFLFSTSTSINRGGESMGLLLFYFRRRGQLYNFALCVQRTFTARC